MDFGKRRKLDEIKVTGVPTHFVLVNPTPRAGELGYPRTSAKSSVSGSPNHETRGNRFSR
jgi:hypothetical protein